MTVCFPPLIKPDGRFSRIRLSGFHFSVQRRFYSTKVGSR